jgi:hypothetical protein
VEKMGNKDDFQKKIQELVHEYLDYRRQLEARKRCLRKRWRVTLTTLVLLPVVGPLLNFLYQGIARQRVVMQFIHAVESRDGKILCELATSEDHLRFHLTSEKTQAALNTLFDGLGTLRVMKIRKCPSRPNQANPDERYWRVYWEDKATGVRLPDKMGDDAFCSIITVKSTTKGYRVDFGALLNSTAKSRWGYEPGLRAAHKIRVTMNSS